MLSKRRVAADRRLHEIKPQKTVDVLSCFFVRSNAYIDIVRSHSMNSKLRLPSSPESAEGRLHGIEPSNSLSNLRNVFCVSVDESLHGKRTAKRLQIVKVYF